MRSTKQEKRYTDEEMGLLKSLFEFNEELPFLIRRVMLQAELSETDKQNLKEVMTPPVLALMKKVFNPELDMDAPIGQMAHLGLALGHDIKQLSPDGAWPYIKAKEQEMEYIDQQLKALAGDFSEPNIKLSDLIDMSGPKTTREQRYIDIMSWNWLLSWIDSCISIQLIANAKATVETAEQRTNRLAKDSSQ